MLKTILSFLILFNFSAEGNTVKGIYIEELINSNISGKEITDIRKLYLTENKALLISPGLPHRLVFDLQKQEVYIVNDTEKRRSVAPLPGYEINSDDILFSEFNNLKDKNLYIKESSNTKKVGKYNALGSAIYMPKIAAITELWLSKETGIQLDAFFSFMEKINPGMQFKKILQMMKKDNSFPVYTATTIVRADETNKYLNISLREISIKDIPVDIFDVPVEYTLTPLVKKE